MLLLQLSDKLPTQVSDRLLVLMLRVSDESYMKVGETIRAIL
jgi:hypothetical protein